MWELSCSIFQFAKNELAFTRKITIFAKKIGKNANKLITYNIKYVKSMNKITFLRSYNESFSSHDLIL